MSKRIEGESPEGGVIRWEEIRKGMTRECVYGGLSAGDIVKIEHPQGEEITGGWEIEGFLPFEDYFIVHARTCVPLQMTNEVLDALKEDLKYPGAALVTNGNLRDIVLVDDLIKWNPEHMDKVIDVTEEKD